MINRTVPADCGKPHQGQKLAEVAILILLLQGVAHGYAMLEALDQFDFGPDKMNASTLYRTLRRFEQEGYATSEWEAGGPGPKRRVYRITDPGKDYLAQWIDALKVRRGRINLMIETYERNESVSQ